jgi:hypothetical protein
MEIESRNRLIQLQQQQMMDAEKARRAAAIRDQQIAAANARRAEQAKIQRQLNTTCTWWKNEYYRARTQSNYTMMQTACSRASNN